MTRERRAATEPREVAQMLVAERLDATVAAHPERLAVVHGDRRLSWAEVSADSDRIARALLARGIRRGDHVAVWMPNHPEWLLIWLAAARIGAALVPVNTRYRPEQAAYVLAKADVVLLVVERTFLDVDFLAAVAAVRPDLPSLRDVVVIGTTGPGALAWDDFLAGGASTTDDELRAAADAVRHDDRVIIVFTSGTTGFPKGVVHAHDVVRMVETVAAWFCLGPGDRVLGHLPLFHVAGVFSSFMIALVAGGALVQLDRWDPATALAAIERERVSVLSGIPTHFVDLLGCPAVHSADLDSLRAGWIGGSFIPPEVVYGARDVLGMEALLPVYGMTETTSSTTLGRPTDPPESLALGRGVPLGGFDVAVVDPQSRVPVPVGVEGEVAVRGYPVMTGYWREPEATAAVLDADGWFHTGDIGTFDDQGYLRITGRLSDKFIVGGTNVHPADVERVLLGHEHVVAAHVVPRPDRRLGEVPVAFVEPAAGVDLVPAALRDWAAQRLASFTVPAEVIVVREWPMTPTGKVVRAQLIEWAGGR